MNYEELNRLQAERNKAEHMVEVWQHECNRLRQSIHSTSKGIRKQRVHHLCNMGGTIESLCPAIAELDRIPFYQTIREIFALPDAQRIIAKAGQK